MIRNVVVGGRLAVKMELWLNDSTDRVTWSKVNELTDDGTYGGNASSARPGPARHPGRAGRSRTRHPTEAQAALMGWVQ